MDERPIRKIAALKDRDLAWRTLSLLYRVIRNLCNSPTTANSLSTRSKALQEALEVDEFKQLLLECGFVKQIDEFEERWVASHVSPIQIARMTDLLPIIDGYLANCKPASSSERFAQDQTRAHRSYIDKMLQQAEEDRIMKLESERIRVEKLKTQQRKRQEDLAQQKLAFRERIYGRRSDT